MLSCLKTRIRNLFTPPSPVQPALGQPLNQKNELMQDIPLRFGLPDTLPPLGRRHLRGCIVFGGMGLLVLLIGLFPSLRPSPRAALPLAVCWLALPAWGIFRMLTGKSRADHQKRDERENGTRTQVVLFAVLIVGLGIGYFAWARHFGVAAPVILGSLLLIEGLAAAIVSLTEWWRLSHLGIAAGLIAGGFCLPFFDSGSIAIPVGAAFLFGSSASAVILSWQLRMDTP
jgi:hypothetical protein